MTFLSSVRSLKHSKCNMFAEMMMTHSSSDIFRGHSPPSSFKQLEGHGVEYLFQDMLGE